MSKKFIVETSDIVENTNQIDTYFETKKDSSYILIEVIKKYLMSK